MGSTKFKGTMIWNRILIALVFGLTGVVIWMGLTRPETSMAEPTLPALVQATAVVPADHAMLIVLNTEQVSSELIPVTGFIPGDVSVFIPAGAIKDSGTISIIKREPNMYPDDGEAGWIRPVIVNVEYEDAQGEPVADMVFEKPIEVCFAMTDEEWVSYSSNPDGYQIQTYDESVKPHAWVALPLIEYPDSNQVCGKTDKLGLFAFAIQGEIPLTGSATEVYEP